MSTGKIYSLKSITYCKEFEQSVKTELDLVESYLNIEQWSQTISFSQILKDKLKTAIRVKESLMKMHGINDLKEVTGFKCQVCSAVFSWPTALGGHMSKAHPNHKKPLKSKNLIEDQAEQEIIKKDELNYEATRMHRDDSVDLAYVN